MPLSRLYNTTADAVGAVEDLKLAGFTDELIQFVAQGPDYISGDSLVRKGVMPTNGARYAEAVRAGATLLIVDSPLGTGATAAQILEARRPGDTGSPKAVYEGGTWSESTPMSSAIHLPLLSDNPSPLSDALGLPVLSKNQRGDDWSLGMPTLALLQRGPNASIGLPTLSRNQRAPSWSLGLPTLASNQRGPARSFGLPTLAKDQHAKASLLDNPAPLSALLGLPLLIESEF